MGRMALLGCLGALVLAVIICGGWFIGVRNNLVTLDESVNQQWAQVESQYQRRYDLIPNLVRTVQGAANFEQSRQRVRQPLLGVGELFHLRRIVRQSRGPARRSGGRLHLTDA